MAMERRTMNNEASPTAPEEVVKTNSRLVDNTVLNASLEEEMRSAHGGWRETLRMALDRAGKPLKPRETRQQLGRDRTKVLIVLVSVAVVLLLFFLGLFSSPNKPAHLPSENPRGRQPNRGQKV